MAEQPRRKPSRISQAKRRGPVPTRSSNRWIAWIGFSALGIVAILAGFAGIRAIIDTQDKQVSGEQSSDIAKTGPGATVDDGFGGLPSSTAKVLALGMRENTYPSDQFKVPAGIMLRELARQALLMAARDELGLQTRDLGLHEEMAQIKDSGAGPIEIMAHIGENREFSIELRGRRPGQVPVVLSTSAFTLPESNWLIVVTERLEPLIRNEFSSFLKEAGFAGSGHMVKPEAPVGDATEQRLHPLDSISQFVAIRALHGMIQSDGESPDRLEALARAYANLGSLTEMHWSCAHKSFKARALLYAERLVAVEKRSPRALWNRAYVRALVGLHGPALSDIAEATGKGGDAKPELPSPPVWGEAIRAFCRYEPEKLRQAADHSENAHLVPYLRLLTDEMSRDQGLVVSACREMLAAHPDCDRAVETLISVRGVQLQRQTTFPALAEFSSSLYRRLGTVPDLPTAVETIVKGRVGAVAGGAAAGNEVAIRLDLLRLWF